MRTWQTGRIGLDEADRLVSGDTTGPGREGLAALLDAANSPPTRGELAGESDAVARFAAARRGVVPPDPPRGEGHVRVSPSARAVAMKVAAGIVALAVGGTALAAEAGTLPATAQQHAHRLFSSLGVPAPTLGSRPLRSGTGAGPSDDPTTVPRPSRTPSPTVSASAPVASHRGLCRAWAAEKKPHGRAMSAASRRALAAAAGGTDNIADYCRTLLITTPPPPSASPAPDHPGKGNGKGNGTGKTRPTPGPRH
jgi:hypothetical protein